MDQKWVENASPRFRAGARPSSEQTGPGQPLAVPARGRAGASERKVPPRTPWWVEIVEERPLLKGFLRRMERERSSINPDEILRREVLLLARTPWPATPECAGAETLRAFLEDRLDDGSQQSLEEHMGGPCRHCLRNLATIHEEPESSGPTSAPL